VSLARFTPSVRSLRGGMLRCRYHLLIHCKMAESLRLGTSSISAMVVSIIHSVLQMLKLSFKNISVQLIPYHIARLTKIDKLWQRSQLPQPPCHRAWLGTPSFLQSHGRPCDCSPPITEGLASANLPSGNRRLKPCPGAGHVIIILPNWEGFGCATGLGYGS